MNHYPLISSRQKFPYVDYSRSKRAGKRVNSLPVKMQFSRVWITPVYQMWFALYTLIYHHAEILTSCFSNKVYHLMNWPLYLILSNFPRAPCNTVNIFMKHNVAFACVGLRWTSQVVVVLLFQANNTAMERYNIIQNKLLEATREAIRLIGLVALIMAYKVNKCMWLQGLGVRARTEGCIMAQKEHVDSEGWGASLLS